MRQNAKAWNFAGLVAVLSGLVGCDLPKPVVLDPTSSDTASVEGVGSAPNDPASVAYEPLPEHGRVELSNLRIEWDDSFSIDWKKTGSAPYGTKLVVKQPGSPRTLEMGVNIWPHETSGTISGSVISFGGGKVRLIDSGMEAYLVTLEGDARHKISNSVTAGDASITPTRPAAKAASASATAPVPDNLVDLPADVTVPDGTKLMIFSEGRYHSVTVSRVHPAGGVLIRWDDRNFSGVFPRSSLKIDQVVLADLRKADDAAKATANAPAHPTMPSTASGRQEQSIPVGEDLLAPIPPGLQLTPGMRLYAFWGGKWLPVTVIHTVGPESTKIHWDGWSDSWDEVKPLNDLRIERSKLP